MSFLEVQKVCKNFGGLAAVKDVDLRVEKEGGVVALIGPNGAGKTTLFNVIAGVYHPNSGRVVFQGKDISKLKPHDVCALGIARTFQIIRPFASMSMLKNVMVGAFLRTNDSGEAREISMEALTLVGLSAYRDAPAVDVPVPILKRLEIARALATKPKLLLLDEVVAGCNPKEMLELVDLLKRVHERGIPLVLVEHVMKAVMAISERVVVMDHGERIAEGTPEEVTSDERVIKAYLGVEYASA